VNGRKQASIRKEKCSCGALRIRVTPKSREPSSEGEKDFLERNISLMPPSALGKRAYER
jgi:hypothetical protein